ncbi:hypothetical protein ABZ816_31235 [Actinosynnema sp. NPDC047251]
MRTRAAEHLTFEELVEREVRSSVELGDPRQRAELEADIRADFRRRVDQYSRGCPVTSG